MTLSIALASALLLPALGAQTQDIAAIRAAEDARASSPQGLAPILAALETRSPREQQIAVRALGRLERPDLSATIARLLAAPSPVVRAEAANALGQAVFNGPAEQAITHLMPRLADEQDPVVRGAILQTIGRLPYSSLAQVRRAERTLMSELTDSTAPHTVMIGAARGMESLIRRNAAQHPPTEETLASLQALATFGLSSPAAAGGPSDAARIRRLITAAVISGGEADNDFLTAASMDPDNQVRRMSLLGAGAIADLPTRGRIIARGIRDPAPSVRYEALRAYGRRLQPEFGCEPILSATLDEDPHVTLLAIDLLGSGCATGEPAEQLLAGLAGQLDLAGSSSWHEAAHAIVSLARIAPARARSMELSFATNSIWQVRMYGARAAVQLSSVDQLRTLAFDDHHNVRQAAIAGLQQLEAPNVDSIYINALEHTDYQLVRTAARGFTASSDQQSVVPALLAALDRISAQQRATSRDARIALIEALSQFPGSAAQSGLRPYIVDFDPVVATRAAEILTDWTDTDYSAQAVMLPRTAVPSESEIAALEQSRVLLYIGGLGQVTIRLFASDTPTNSARFVRLALAGYFDGLTFHRVAPNFVIQGGSPGANEYAGDGSFTRDELTARMNSRGTVGISTRGRDTGDAQIFVNLVDNMRLDHNYTIIGEIDAGMDVVDAVTEGAVIERVEVRRSRE